MYEFCMTIRITPFDGSTSEGYILEDVALLNCLQSGVFFDNHEELTMFAKALDLPRWVQEPESDVNSFIWSS